MSTSGSREINVTPLIDVLLVLLIIFLVMMPIMMQMLTVALPPSEPGAILEGTTVTLKLQPDLSASLDDGPPFEAHELAARLRPKLANARAVFLDTSDATPWFGLTAAVDTIRGVASDVRQPDLPVAIRLRNLEE